MIWSVVSTALAQSTVCANGCDFDTIGEAVGSVQPFTEQQFAVANANYLELESVRIGPDRTVTLSGPGGVTITNGGDGATFLVSGANAELIVEGFAITAFNDRALEVLEGGWVDVRDSVLYSIGLQPEGGAVLVDHGTFIARDSLFLDNVATSGGGHLVGRDSVVDLQNCLFRGGFARRGGAALFEGSPGLPTSVTITNGTFQDNLAAESGGAIAVSGNVTLEILDSTFERNTADSGGVLADQGFVDNGSPTVTIERSIFAENTGQASGGAIAALEAAYTITDSTIRDNTAPDGGAVWIGGGSFTMDRSLLCRNTGTNGGAVYSRTPIPQSWLNNRLIENTAEQTGGAIDHAGGLLTMRHHNFLGNAAPDGGAIRTTSEVFLRNSLVGWTEGSTALEGPTLLEDWNAFWSNVAGNILETAADPVEGISQDVVVDPLLELFEPGSGCDAIDDFYSWYGPLRDGGDPVTANDPNNSRADLGAFGGASAPLPPWRDDIDFDEYPPIYDCMEGESTVHPEALDEAYDGIDADCDRGNDFDIDDDGFEVDLDCDDEDASTYPGALERPGRGDQNCDGRIDVDGDGYSPPDDCNDTDDRIHPGAVEDPDPDVDLDCTEPADVIRPLAPRPCATSPIPGSAGAAVVLLLVLMCRRRR
jgi:predicted outer membrane repeat protein